ncbi:Kazal-type serine protease inhibitor family protein [Hoeflea ulvae]|uniref:Kazal-type serine protease inhibitor n=1 Tax=Hoeflea ulvae TaxID=2983764 RepID=A0ABT3YER1_9HYPH|nr:Kazal-type serine protease inhibitor [Hoeflea ulvae]MCY0094338.1 Kazal-type serine protease inhibitor [Hoeflea ulvae]
MSTLLGVAMLVGAALTLSGCEVTETRVDYRAGPMCPANYDPVCAERRGEQRTFPNACQARQSDWRVVANGQCGAMDYGNNRRDRDDRSRDDWSRDDRGSSRDRDGRRDSNRGRDDTQSRRDRSRPGQSSSQNACPQGDEPVCGQLGSSALTFPNRCEMQRSGATEISARMCRGGRG